MLYLFHIGIQGLNTFPAMSAISKLNLFLNNVMSHEEPTILDNGLF